MTAQDSRTRETECDLLVVGSGAGGLSAATTAAWHGLRETIARLAGTGTHVLDVEVLRLRPDAADGGLASWAP